MHYEAISKRRFFLNFFRPYNVSSSTYAQYVIYNLFIFGLWQLSDTWNVGTQVGIKPFVIRNILRHNIINKAVCLSLQKVSIKSNIHFASNTPWSKSQFFLLTAFKSLPKIRYFKARKFVNWRVTEICIEPRLDPLF